MSELVDASVIEQIVGVKRSEGRHVGRAVSHSGEFYILHSQRCLDSSIDLRDCEFSLALDRGIDTGAFGLWEGKQDVPWFIDEIEGWLFPSEVAE